MLQSFLDWLKPKSYRIVHDPMLGYLPEFWDEWDWRVIKNDATLGVHHESAPGFRDHWAASEQAAGVRINLHAAARGQKVIWRG